MIISLLTITNSKKKAINLKKERKKRKKNCEQMKGFELEMPML